MSSVSKWHLVNLVKLITYEVQLETCDELETCAAQDLVHLEFG